jgi:hypothetical protein
VGPSYRSSPGFVAALGGALVGYVAGACLALLFLWPFALASSTALALGTGDWYQGLGRLALAGLILVGTQVAATAWVTQHVSALLGDAPVRFRRALGAVLLGHVVNVLIGSAAADAALPVVGGAWGGLVVVALVVSSGRSDPLASAA